MQMNVTEASRYAAFEKNFCLVESQKKLTFKSDFQLPTGPLKGSEVPEGFWSKRNAAVAR